MGGIAGQIQQVTGNVGQPAQQPGQVPQTANVDFGFNNTQNVPFRPQQIPGQLQPIPSDKQSFQAALNAPQNYAYGGSGNYGIFGGAYTPEEIQAIQAGGGYDSPGSLYRGQQILAGQQVQPFNPGQVQIQPYPMPPVQTRPRPPVIQPGPGVFPQPRPQDSKRGLGGLQLDKFRRRLG